MIQLKFKKLHISNKLFKCNNLVKYNKKLWISIKSDLWFLVGKWCTNSVINEMQINLFLPEKNIWFSKYFILHTLFYVIDELKNWFRIPSLRVFKSLEPTQMSSFFCWNKFNFFVFFYSFYRNGFEIYHWIILSC